MLVAVVLCGAGSAWGETKTETITFSKLGYQNGVKYGTTTQGDVTITFGDGDNDGKYYTTGSGMRIYGEGHATFTASDNLITKVKLTFASSYAPSSSDNRTIWNPNQGVTISNDKTIWEGSATSVSITRPSGSGHWRLQVVEVTYETSGGPTLQESDLAITDAPVALSFDLYNNNSAQTVSFTSSSTGAVTVSESEYVATSVSGNTITVTPVKKTPSAQTITVSQAADDNYQAGTATFTVTVDDKTPFVGGDVTFDATQDKGTSPLLKNGVTFACTNGVLNNGSEYRLYKNSETTFSTNSGKITKIEFTGVSGNPISGFGDTDGLTTNGNNGTWTGSATSVSFTASGAQVRASKIVVTVIPEGAVTPPTISGTTPFLGETTVTITGDDGAVIYYTTDGTDPTTNSTQYTAPFTIRATTTVKAIAVKDNNSSDVATKEFVKTVSYKLNEANGLAADDYIFEFDNAVVTYVNGSYVFIEDANGAILYYKSGSGLTAGKVINGFKNVTWAVFNGQPEATSISDLETTTGEVPVPTTMTIAAILNNPTSNMSKFVKLEGVEASETNDGFNLIQDGNVIAFYGRNSAAVEDGKTYDIIGFLGKHNDNYQFVVYTQDHITELGVEKQDPTIVVADASVAYGSTYTIDDSVIEGGEITVTSGNAAVATVNGLVITPVAVGSVEITVATAENDHYYAGSQTFTLTITQPEGQTEAPTASEGEVLFYESFNLNDGTGGNDNEWSGSIATNNISYDGEAWFVTKANGAKQCAKFGSSSAAGSAQTPDITGVVGTTYTLTFKAAPWASESTNMQVTATGATISGISVDEMTTGQWNEFTATVTPTATTFSVTFEASKNRFFLDEVKIEAPASAAPTESYKIPSSGLGTYCSQYPIDLDELPDGVKAYGVASQSETSVTLTELTGEIKGGVGFIIEGEGNTNLTFTFADSSNEPESLLEGTLAPTYLPAGTAWGLKNGKFQPNLAGTLPEHKAYLPAETSTGGAVKELIIVFNDADGITTTRTITDAATIYDLTGRRLQSTQKGVNIVNGKKILVK